MRVEIDGIGAIDESHREHRIVARQVPIPPAWVMRSMFRARHVLGRTHRTLVPGTARILEGSFGLIETKSLGVAADLGIADALEAGPLTTEALAGKVGADPDALARLLRLLVSIGYFAQKDGAWKNNATSELLREDHPESMRAWALLPGQRLGGHDLERAGDLGADRGLGH